MVENQSSIGFSLYLAWKVNIERNRLGRRVNYFTIKSIVSSNELVPSSTRTKENEIRMEKKNQQMPLDHIQTFSQNPSNVINVPIIFVIRQFLVRF